MKPILLLSSAVIACSVLLGACSRDSEPMQTLASLAPAVPQIDPANYVQTAGMGDLFEVEAGKVAARRGRSAEVRHFARMMVQAHTESTRKIRAAATASGLAAGLPTTLDPAHADMLAALKSAPRADFDRQYIVGQVQGHQEALKLQQSYADSGSDPNLKAVAMELAPIVQQHLSEAQGIESSLQ